MSAYTLPHVTPFTSCWRNSLMRGDGPRVGHPRPVWTLVASGVDRTVEHLLAALDLQHHERLGGVAVLVQRDRAGDAVVVLGRRDQLAQLRLGGLPLRRAGLARAERLER